jgi:hypothetical protein
MGAPSTNFFQKLIQIHKMWLKLAKIGNNWPIFKRFSAIFTFFRSWNIPELRPFLNNYIQKWDFWKKIQKFHFCSILPILATIYEVKITFWKKLVEGAPITYFQINIFWFYMLWGIQNQLRIFFARSSGSTRPSAWCEQLFLHSWPMSNIVFHSEMLYLSCSRKVHLCHPVILKCANCANDTKERKWIGAWVLKCSPLK